MPPFADGRMPETPEVNGRPVAFVSVTEVGVPKAPLAKRATPVPLSSDRTPRNCAEVVAAN